MFSDKTAIRRALEQEIVGQGRAVEQLSAYLERALRRLGTTRETLGSVLLAGPPGCGKRHLALCAARAVLGSEELLTVIDCALFERPNAFIERLLSDAGRRNPLRLAEGSPPIRMLLLDNVDHAAAAVQIVCDHILTYGYLDTSPGVRLLFHSTLFFLRVNLRAGEGETESGTIGFTGPAHPRTTLSVIAERVRRDLPPQILNLAEEIIVLEPMDEAHLSELVSRYEHRLTAHAASLGFRLKVEREVRELIVTRVLEHGVASAARKVTRLFRDDLEPWLSRLALPLLAPGTEMQLTRSGDHLALVARMPNQTATLVDVPLD